MAVQKEVRGSGRLSASNLRWIKKITVWGRKHPDKRKWAVFALVSSIILFYLIYEIKKFICTYLQQHKSRLASATGVLAVLILIVLQTGTAGGLQIPGISEARAKQLIERTQRESRKAENLEDVSDLIADNLRILHDENEDCVAWLYVDGMGISYPVMQHLQDENYYLNRDFNGKENKNGSLILDNDSSLDVAGVNLIIHGHHLKNGEMFGDLQKYEDQDWGEQHNVIELLTPDGIRTYRLYAAFYSKVYYETEDVFKYYNYFGGIGEDKEEIDSAMADFKRFRDGISRMALYDTGVDVQFGDEFITLSTCSYHAENGRFVVVAKRIYG